MEQCGRIERLTTHKVALAERTTAVQTSVLAADLAEADGLTLRKDLNEELLWHGVRLGGGEDPTVCVGCPSAPHPPPTFCTYPLHLTRACTRAQRPRARNTAHTPPLLPVQLVLQSILQSNLEERRAGVGAGTHFGEGIYLAEDIGKADQYAGVAPVRVCGAAPATAGMPSSPQPLVSCRRMLHGQERGFSSGWAMHQRLYGDTYMSLAPTHHIAQPTTSQISIACLMARGPARCLQRWGTQDGCARPP